MIVDHRTYDIKPGCLALWLKLYEDKGLPLQLKYLGRNVGFYVTEIGPLNQVVHLWAYDSLADRQARRDAMEADPAWQEFRRLSNEGGWVLRQEIKILKPTGFSAIQ
ncbi:MAG: NIPSNAP family protein [Thalassobaculales bacterium]